ncbi:hypothetical protein AKJ48_01260 [candidate division MSBL1 archaeon SCGC-AAA261O19]|uniref:Uncharacterized protein n=1 Tax=candidate division MSBL1 archaeon SCGC-AAA261O19 TaxID=1698277 RepID=A0A133VEE3_9EURY|nr:hypothetical protein AKJ48_01260 [candidate division MSBL1 archaeon SCGC-AAA261O19]
MEPQLGQNLTLSERKARINKVKGRQMKEGLTPNALASIWRHLSGRVLPSSFLPFRIGDSTFTLLLIFHPASSVSLNRERDL